MVPEVSELHLLGVTFDKDLSFRTHIRQLKVRGTQRLEFLHKASRVLGPSGRMTVYKGFVLQVLKYGMLTRMRAAPSTLHRLSTVQRRALHITGPGSYLPSLDVRRVVGALSLLYKLRCLQRPTTLTRLLPPSAPPRQQATRLQLAATHDQQLACPLPSHGCHNNVLRSFPEAVVLIWNSLPSRLLQSQPTPQGLEMFKTKAFHHLRCTHWQWATDSL